MNNNMNYDTHSGLPLNYNGIYVGGLNNLLEADPKAREYYLALPKEKRDMLFGMQENINSFEALRNAAD